MSQNPYESPQHPPADVPPQNGEYDVQQDERNYGRALLLVPAIALMLLAGLDEIRQVQLTILGMQSAEQARVGPIGVLLGSGIRMLFQFTVITGGYKMLRLKSYGIAMMAALFSMIPICSPLVVLGIPFGIWALVVLGNPRVRESFQ